VIIVNSNEMVRRTQLCFGGRGCDVDVDALCGYRDRRLRVVLLRSCRSRSRLRLSDSLQGLGLLLLHLFHPLLQLRGALDSAIRTSLSWVIERDTLVVAMRAYTACFRCRDADEPPGSRQTTVERGR